MEIVSDVKYSFKLHTCNQRYLQAMGYWNIFVCVQWINFRWMYKEMVSRASHRQQRRGEKNMLCSSKTEEEERWNY